MLCFVFLAWHTNFFQNLNLKNVLWISRTSHSVDARNWFKNPPTWDPRESSIVAITSFNNKKKNINIKSTPSRGFYFAPRGFEIDIFILFPFKISAPFLLLNAEAVTSYHTDSSLYKYLQIAKLRPLSCLLPTFNHIITDSKKREHRNHLSHKKIEISKDFW